MLPSQLPKPPKQEIPHAPAAHEAVPLVCEQALPQVPQFATVMLVFVSQPSSCLLLLQSPNPTLQLPAHEPAVQATPFMFCVEHSTPQPPQLLVVVVGVSQPSDCLLLLQSAKPVLQAPMQA